MRSSYLFLFLLLVTLSSALQAQETDHILVRDVVQDYIDGTSFNRPELLESAFDSNITMYFTKDNKPWMPSREEYIGFFRGKEPGTPTGRIGNIRLIEIAGDIATAKAEILIPARQRLYIDYFLLKKINNRWRIVSKTASNGPSNHTGRRILIAVSNATTYGNSDLPTGNHFGEITEAYHVFTEAGYTVDFVSPRGEDVAVTYMSSVDAVTAPYLRDAEFWYRIEHTLAAESVQSADYAAIYFPGGGASMFGLADDPEIQRLTREIYEGNGAVAAVCHGTAGITNTKLSDGTPLLSGKELTGYPDGRERKDLPYYQTFPFQIDKRVIDQGGRFRSQPEPNTGFFVVDGRLVTGMDHSATGKVARAVVMILRQDY